MDPSTGIRLIVDAHRADQGGPAPITLDMEFAEEGGEGPTPYEVLLHAALVGDAKRFTRQDAVEEAWRVMQPLLDAPSAVHSYAPGSWGPKEGDDLVAGFGRWHGPWIES
jgi:glucose-6-phosphate 1-dehydrogenase